MMRKTLGRWSVAAVGLATVLLCAVAGPATADSGDQLSVSRDGHTWTDDIDRPLFRPDLRVVPGDDVTSSFWVRNNSDDPGILTVDIHLNDLVGDLPLDVTATGAGETWSSADGDQPSVVLDAGRTEEIAVHVHLPWSAGNR